MGAGVRGKVKIIGGRGGWGVKFYAGCYLTDDYPLPPHTHTRAHPPLTPGKKMNSSNPFPAFLAHSKCQKAINLHVVLKII